MRKINKKDKMAERGMVVTDKHIYKLHSKTFKPLRSPIPILEVRIDLRLSCFCLPVAIYYPTVKNQIGCSTMLAGDTVLLAENEKELQRMMDEFHWEGV